MNRKKILICGATGSIGTQAIEIIEKEEYELVGFSFGNNIKLAKKIKNKFPNALVYSPLNNKYNDVNSFDELIFKTKPDILLNSIVGFAGFDVSILAIKNNIDLALANKESLVVGGWVLKKMMKYSTSKIYPIDSEHSSIYDCIINSKKEVDSIILTASGGLFFQTLKKDLVDVKFNDAIKHPNWNMGYKISIDSSTLINKCFEIIEAYYLFGTKKISVLREKNSYIHGIVKFKDNSSWLNCSMPDMRWSIQQGLSLYSSNSKIISDINLTEKPIVFEEINPKKWKPIQWAYDFLETNNYAIPIIINSANEESISLFKENKISFIDIIKNIEKCLKKFSNFSITNVKEIYALNELVKTYIRR